MVEGEAAIISIPQHGARNLCPEAPVELVANRVHESGPNRPLGLTRIS
jgi:hypothetical protein